MNAEPGDLVVCVVAGPIFGARYNSLGVGLREGATYRVMSCRVDPHDGEPVYDLHEVESRHGYLQCRFRKIRPDKHEPCEEEFRILLQLSKRRVKA